MAEHSNEASAASVTFSEFELQTPSTPSEDSALEEASEKKEEKVIERPQILAERNAKKVSALSIKSIQKKNSLWQLKPGFYIKCRRKFQIQNLFRPLHMKIMPAPAVNVHL